MKPWQFLILAGLFVLVVCVILGALNLAMPLIIGPPTPTPTRTPTPRPTVVPTPTHSGPAIIEFGSTVDESTSTIFLRGATTHFPDPTSGNDIAWLVSLGRAVGTTTPELVVSMSTGSAGGEVVIDSNPIRLADPSFDIIYGTLSSALYFTPGTYTLRLMAGDSILAQGDFDVP